MVQPSMSIRTKLILLILGTNILLILPMIYSIGHTTKKEFDTVLSYELEQMQSLSQNIFNINEHNEAIATEQLAQDPRLLHFLSQNSKLVLENVFRQERRLMKCSLIVLLDDKGTIIGQTPEWKLSQKEVDALSFVKKSYALKTAQHGLLKKNSLLQYHTALLYKKGTVVGMVLTAKLIDKAVLQALKANTDLEYALVYKARVLDTTFKDVFTLPFNHHQLEWLDMHPDESLMTKMTDTHYVVSMHLLGTDEVKIPIYLLIALKDTLPSEVLDKAFINVVLIFFVALLIIAIMATLLSHQIYRMFSKFIAFTEQIKSGDYKSSIEFKTNDEFEVLAYNLDTMRVAIYEQEQRLRNYATDLEKTIDKSTDKLHAQDSFLHTIFDLQEELIFIIKNAEIDYANRAALKFFAYEGLLAFASQKKFFKLPGMERDEDFHHMLINGAPFPNQVDIMDTNGEKTHFEVKFYPMIDQNTYIIVFNNITVHQNEKEALYQLATIDSLTRLPNRFDFENKFEYVRHQLLRSKLEAVLCIVDIDDFKKVNDTYGHLTGDKVLVKLAGLMTSSIRASDLIARWGGDEFVIVFYPTTVNNAFKILKTLKELIEESDIYDDIPHITCSFGATVLRSDDDMNMSFKKADEALYRAKKRGKNWICFSE